jgi:hypothetical protein
VPPHCPVKPSYDKSLHVIHVSSSPIESSHTQEDHASILVKQMQPLQQRVHNNLQQAKQATSSTRQTTHQGLDSVKFSIRDLMQWGPLLPKGGGFTEEEISGHPPIPLAQNMGFHLGIFSTVFWVLNFQGHFEALNNVFWDATNPKR